MKITKHMQSCFLLETNYGKILIDPGTYVFAQEGVDPNDFRDINAVVITHEHPDHFDIDNIEKIYQKFFPTFYATPATKDLIIARIPNAEVKILGLMENEKINDFVLSGASSKHGPLPTGAEPPEVSGVVISDGKVTFYSPGDSIFLDHDIRADAIAAPICGEVVMDIAKAKNELLALKPKIAIPIHYDNPRFPVNVGDFAEAMDGTGIEIKVLQPGETIDF